MFAFLNQKKNLVESSKLCAKCLGKKNIEYKFKKFPTEYAAYLPPGARGSNKSASCCYQDNGLCSETFTLDQMNDDFGADRIEHLVAKSACEIHLILDQVKKHSNNFTESFVCIFPNKKSDPIRKLKYNVTITGKGKDTVIDIICDELISSSISDGQVGILVTDTDEDGDILSRLRDSDPTLKKIYFINPPIFDVLPHFTRFSKTLEMLDGKKFTEGTDFSILKYEPITITFNLYDLFEKYRTFENCYNMSVKEKSVVCECYDIIKFSLPCIHCLVENK